MAVVTKDMGTKNKLFQLILVFALACAPLESSNTLVTLHKEKVLDVLSKVVEVLGGKDNIKLSQKWSYTAMVKSSVVSTYDPPKFIDFSEYFSPPKRIRRDFATRIPLKLGKKVINSFHIFDGENGWSNENAVGKIIKCKDKEELRRVSSKWIQVHIGGWFLEILENSDNYNFELKEVRLDGKDFFKLRIQPRPELYRYVYINQKTYIPERRETFLESKNPQSWDIRFHDYREVHNLLMPFRIKTDYKSKEMYESDETLMVDIKFGPEVEISEDKFKDPKK